MRFICFQTGSGHRYTGWAWIELESDLATRNPGGTALGREESGAVRRKGLLRLEKKTKINKKQTFKQTTL